MLLALAHPPALVGLILGFLVGVVAVGLVQSRVTRTPRPSGRGAFGRYVDPFGANAAAHGAVGWAVPPDVGRWRRGAGRRRAIVVILLAPLTHLVLAALGFAALAGLGHRGDLALDPRSVLYGLPGGVPFAVMTLLGFSAVNLTMALLHVIPLPPMALGRIMLLLAPPTPAWQRAAYQLEDNNWGIGILLALSLPLFSGAALSGALTAAISRPILSAIAGTGSG